MRLAYLILSHHLPDQLIRLVGALKERGDSFFIHVDRRAPQLMHDSVQRAFRADASVRLVPPQICYWGSFGIVAATLAGIRLLRDSGISFDRLLLLSGQDYPIKPPRYIKAFLQRHPDQEFIESFPLTLPNKWTDHDGPFRDLNRILHWHLNFRSRFVHIPIRRPLPPRMQPHGGSQWWALSRGCVEHLDEFIRGNPKIVDYFKRAFIPDELFFQTLVANSPFADRIRGSSLTYEDWDTPRPPFPATLDVSYLPILASSHKLFARKFDPRTDAQVLDRIDQSLLQRRQGPDVPQPGPLAPAVSGRAKAQPAPAPGA